MAIGETPITVVGNLVDDPELRYTPSGSAVANFRVASTSRRFDSQSNGWVEGDTLFLTCNVWRQAAENVAETLHKGMRVIVNGRLRQRSFDTREGERRTVFEIEVDDVGPSLKYASAEVKRNPPSGGGGNYGGGGYGGGGGGYQNNNASGGQPAGNRGGYQGNNRNQGGNNQPQPDSDPWSTAPAAGGFNNQQDDPPF
ncbi:single-stranded DNA-binding protein [Corynebacterium mendelii]|uniref:Single-stranded DNA-binding protein n=1 Tax=Corynebacterium mendelii TaxID=2765362 RepID=A0A939IY68_9CORY|nr:single-stranded DNA-binding protein [Corynebacterium mendelii]MBN9644362.1 single-stranded DNA-binding protein [Corynebacterium mendelii]